MQCRHPVFFIYLILFQHVSALTSKIGIYTLTSHRAQEFACDHLMAIDFVSCERLWPIELFVPSSALAVSLQVGNGKPGKLLNH